jgi:hypothetical protein
MRDTVLYISLILGLMFPLIWLAKGLQSENYFAQLLAKAPYMGVHLTQTIAAAPQSIVREWDRVFDLYLNSNNDSSRQELEELAGSGDESV